MSDSRLLELEEALKNIKWDIVGLSEVRKIGENIEEFDEYIFYYKGHKKGMSGIGFLVKKYLKSNIINFIGISDRIGVLNIKFDGFTKTWSILQIYAPTEQATKLEKDQFYKELTETMPNLNKIVIIMGDFNSQVGSKSNTEEYVLGNFSSGKRNENGQRLVDFAFAHNLKLMNSFFKKKYARKWTWISPNGINKNEIDHILTNTPKIFCDIDTINKFNFNTDHRILRAIIYNKDIKIIRKNIKTCNNTVNLPIPAETLDDLKLSLYGIKNFTTLQNKYNYLERILL